MLAVLVALLTDALIGDPSALWRRVPHPVVWIGQLIARFDHGLNREIDTFGRRKVMGVIALGLLLAACGGVAIALTLAFDTLPLPWLWTGLAGSTLIAQKSLHDHVAAVQRAFGEGGLEAARRAVAHVVGRDPLSLDDAAVCRAAIETTAENFSDGVVAPTFWFALFGLPGLILYKAINTADSMIGHRSARHEAFGWAAARLDDLVNLVPARLAGLLLALAMPVVRADAVRAARVMLRDAHLHRSPNAGWPEAAMAGGLGISLAGPRRYGTRLVEDPFLNPGGRRDCGPEDIGRALRIMACACVLQAAVIALIALATA